jgi:putative ABC transport system permease protein
MSYSLNFGFFRLVRQNLRNRPWRNLAAIAAFAIIAGTLFSAQYLVSGAQESLNKGLDRMGADIMVVPKEYSAAGETVLLTGQPTSFFFKDSGFEQIAQLPGVARASPEIFVATLYGQACCAGPVQIIAIDPVKDFTIASWLQENPGVHMGKDDIIVGSGIAGEIGSDLLFYGHQFHIVGRLGHTGLMGVDMAVFTRFEDAYTMADESGIKAVRKLTIPEGMVSAVLVRVTPGSSPAAVAEEIKNQVPGTKTITPNGLLGTISGRLGSVTSLLYESAIAVAAVSIPLLGFVSTLVAHERRKEVAILKALGATRSFILRLMLTESLTLSFTGALAGVGIAGIILIAFQDFIALSLKVPFTIPSPAAILADAGTALLLSAAIGGIAALWPAIRISRSEPYDTIRKGEA